MKSNNGKKLAVLLAALMAVSLTACGNSGSSDTETTTTTTTTAASDDAPEESEAEDESEADDSSEAKDSDITAAEDIPFNAADFKKDELKTAQLKEVAKFSTKDLNFYGDFIYSAEDEEHITCYNYKGEKLGDGNVMQVEKLGDTGVYSFTVLKDDMIYEGLMTPEGEVIQPADQGVGLYKEISDRFLMAFFPEGETTDENEAIYYVTANQFSFMPKDEDTLYKGKVKVYDTVTNKFLENTTVTESPMYKANGDLVSFYDKDHNIIFVNSEDKVLDLGYDYTAVGDRFLMTNNDDGIFIYDHELKPLFKSKYMISEMASSDEFFILNDTESQKKGIMDKNGAIVCEPKFGNVEYAGNGFFAYTYGEYGSKVGLLALDGTEITKEDYKYIRSFDVPGYFNAAKEDGKTDIIDETGKVIVADTDSGFSKEYSYVKTDDTYDFMVWSKNEPALKLASGTYLANNMVFSYKDEAIFDQVTGDKLLEDVEKAHLAYGYLVVESGDEATVYTVE